MGKGEEMKKRTIRKLKRLSACGGAIDWVAQFNSLQAAWGACERPDWMFWLLIRTARPYGKRHKRIILALCKHIKGVLKSLPKNALASRKAINTVRAWAKGEDISIDELRAAADACAVADVTTVATAVVAAVARAATRAGVAAGAAARAAGHGKCNTRAARALRKVFPNPPRLR